MRQTAQFRMRRRIQSVSVITGWLQFTVNPALHRRVPTTIIRARSMKMLVDDLNRTYSIYSEQIPVVSWIGMRSGNLECTEKFIACRALPVGMWFNSAHAHGVADTQKPSFVDRLANH